MCVSANDITDIIVITTLFNQFSDGRSYQLLPNYFKQKSYGLILLTFSSIALWASFTLLIEKIEKLKNPSSALFCDISPFVSCGKLMDNWQSELFGFPNQILGIIAFSIAIFYSVLILSKISLPYWLHRSFNIGTFFGAVFITWLFTQSVFVIHSLCLWCIIVWACHIPIFVLVTIFNIKKGYWGNKVKNVAFFRPLSVPILIVVLWYLIIISCIAIQFFDEFYMMLR